MEIKEKDFETSYKKVIVCVFVEQAYMMHVYIWACVRHFSQKHMVVSLIAEEK